jgi:peroxin-1
LDQLISEVGDHDLHHNLRSSKLAERLADMLSEQKEKQFKRKCGFSVAFMATVRSKKSLHSSLQLPGLFDFEINLGVPDSSCRQSMMSAMIASRQNVCVSEDVDLEALQPRLEGCLASDLRQLVDRAIHSHISRSFDSTEIIIEEEDFETAMDGFSAASLKQLKLHSSETSWQDVGGLDEVCKILKETLELPSKYSLLFSQIPLKLRSGILLYGPPGCGKTMLASAVAKECGLNFISVKGPELLNKYIGASEQSVRDVFERAGAAAPCIVFFDEFDSIAPRRGGDSTGVTDRVVNQLLCHLDGVEGRSNVYVLAATSRPDLIDPALLRPGRLDKSLFCGLPDRAARSSILEASGRKMKLAEDVDLDKLADMTESYSGADLNGLLTSAQILAVHEALDDIKEDSREEVEREEPKPKVKLQIRQKHLLKALEESRTSVSESERKRYESIYANFTGSRTGEFSLQFREGAEKNNKLKTMLK